MERASTSLVRLLTPAGVQRGEGGWLRTGSLSGTEWGTQKRKGKESRSFTDNIAKVDRGAATQQASCMAGRSSRWGSQPDVFILLVFIGVSWFSKYEYFSDWHNQSLSLCFWGESSVHWSSGHIAKVRKGPPEGSLLQYILPWVSMRFYYASHPGHTLCCLFLTAPIRGPWVQGKLGQYSSTLSQNKLKRTGGAAQQ